MGKPKAGEKDWGRPNKEDGGLESGEKPAGEPGCRNGPGINERVQRVDLDCGMGKRDVKLERYGVGKKNFTTRGKTMRGGIIPLWGLHHTLGCGI
jgi:hypothetical protein